MIDRSTLEPWIRSEHLDEDVLARYRATFSSHPARVLVIEDFLTEQKLDKLSRFISQEAEFGEEFGLYSAEGAVAEETWKRADEADRMFKLSRLAGIPAEHQLSTNALTYLSFRQSFQRPEFAAFFEAATGLDLGPSDDFGVHAMKPGDFLRSHSDDVKNRRIALVIYLSPDWESRFGGALVVTDRNDDEVRIDPGFNSVVIFDVVAETTHLVEPIRAEAGDRARFTIGGWYPNPT